MRSGAFGISDAPDYYRLTSITPRRAELGEYLDRGGTFATVVAAMFWFAAPLGTPLRS
jgi:hypothetical protein